MAILMRLLALDFTSQPRKSYSVKFALSPIKDSLIANFYIFFEILFSLADFPNSAFNI